MKRLYFITDTLDSAESISDDVHKLGVSDYNFHVMCRDEAGLYKRHIHSSNIYHDNNIVRQAERGGLIGALVGVMVIITAMFVMNFAVNLVATVGIIAFSMFSGSWIGGFVGISQENYKIEKFHDTLEDGKYLVMVDVTADKMHLIEDMMITRHTEAKHGGVGNTMILPF